MAIANLLIKIGADISELQTSAAKSTRIMEQTASKIDTIGSAVKSSVIAAFSAGAVISFVDKTLSAASAIHDTAAALGISAEAAQRFGFAASQSGASLDDIGRSLNFMNKALAEGDKGTVAALEAAGLSFEKLRAMSPEDAFLAVTAAVKNIANPMQQAQVGTALLGKSWLALAPAIKEGVAELGNATSVMSNDTVKSLADAQDAWEALSNKVTIVTGTMIGHAINLTSEITSGWKSAAKFAENSLKFGVAVAATMADADGAATKAAASVKAVVPPMTGLVDTTDKLTDAQKKAKAAAEAHYKAIASLHDELSGRGAIRAAQDMTQALKGISLAQIEATGNTKRVNDVMREALDVYRATGKIAPQAFTDLYIATAPVPPVIAGITSDLLRMTQQVKLAIPEVQKFGDEFKVVEGVPFGGHIGQQVDLSILKLKELGQTITGSLIDTFQKIPQTIAGAFSGGGGILGALKSLGVQLTDAIARPILEGLSKVQRASVGAGSSIAAAFGGSTGGGAVATVGAIASGLGGAALAATAWGSSMAAAGVAGTVALGAATLGIGAAAVGVALLIKKIAGMSEYEKRMRAAATETQKLQAQVLLAHGSMQQLIIDADLVGINIKEAFKWHDPEAFKGILAELDAKTQLLNASMEEYGFTWEDLGEKARGAKLGQLFDAIKAKTDILVGAGINYHEVLLRQASGYSELVQAAIRTGTEIPIAIQQTLKDLVEMGTLVDENGQSFKDLSQVTWAKTLTQGFDQVTQAIYDLTDALTHGVGGALDELGRRTVRIPIKFDVDNAPGGGSVPEFATGTRGQYVNFGSGQYVQLHGRERIVTESESLGLAGGGDTYVYIGDRAIDSHLVKVVRKDAARGGLRPRAGSGRSY